MELAFLGVAASAAAAAVRVVVYVLDRRRRRPVGAERPGLQMTVETVVDESEREEPGSLRRSVRRSVRVGMVRRTATKARRSGASSGR